MHPTFYLNIFIVVLSFLLTLILILSNIRSIRNLAYALLVLFASFWLISVTITDNLNNIDLAFNWARISMIGPIFILSSILFFSLNFPHAKEMKKKHIFLILFPLILLPLVPTDLNVSDVSLEEWGTALNVGILYYIYFIFFILYFSLSLYILYKKSKDADFKVKQQIKYVILGILLTAVISIFTNLIVILLDMQSISVWGPSSISFLLFFTAYAILRFQFLDIRVFIGRVTYFFFLALILILAYRINIGIDALLWDGPYNIEAFISGVPIAFLVVIFYDAFKKFVQERIDSTLINPDFDPKEVIARFNNEVSTLLSYEDVIDHALATIGKTIRPKYKGILIKVGDQLELTDDNKDGEDINLDFDKLVRIWQETNNYPIISDEIEIELPRVFRNHRSDIFEAIREMRKFDVKVILPVASPNAIVGILLIGQREADAPYNSIQIDYLESIANLVGLALTRAFLYQEVREFNETLQRKVEIATQELAKQNDKLKETLANERDMLDVLGHELRTPLGIIRNALGLFELTHKSGKVKKEDIDKFVDIANNNIRREIQLLETILASAKIDNAKLDLNFENINSADIVKESFEAYKYEAEKKNLKLTMDIPSEPLPSYVDKLRIQQVLDNLVSNAIKYTETGEVVIGIKDEGRFIRYYVKDTGYGIPKEDIPKLGQKFFRVNTYLNSNGKIGDRKIVRPGGNGIGLYVVFQLVKYMGGEVHVESVVGKGSTFSFTVLKYTPEVESQHEILTQAKSQNGKK